MEKASCGRCNGKGIIPRFSHILGGVCFRCWGSGDDPQSMYDLRKWLERARREYRQLRAQAASAKGTKKAALEAMLRSLVTTGKVNAAKLARMEKSYSADRQMAQGLFAAPGL